jgi:microcystin-dependent protein
MALDFPSNPVDGQVYGSYIYNLATGAWKASSQSATVAITSPAKPTTANNGDIWVNTTTGIAFVYYNDGNTSQWMELLSSAVPAVNEIMPSGSILQTARSTAPTGWLLCQGQAISRTTYSVLYSAIGTVYGSGDGTTTFNIPNLQGKVPVGKDSGTFVILGATGGAETVTLTEAQIPSHTHIQNSHNHTQDAHTHSNTLQVKANVGDLANGQTNLDDFPGSMGPISATNQTVGGMTGSITANTATNQATTATNQNTGGGGSHTNLQPYIVLNYMIKV